MPRISRSRINGKVILKNLKICTIRKRNSYRKREVHLYSTTMVRAHQDSMETEKVEKKLLYRHSQKRSWKWWDSPYKFNCDLGKQTCGKSIKMGQRIDLHQNVNPSRYNCRFVEMGRESNQIQLSVCGNGQRVYLDSTVGLQKWVESPSRFNCRSWKWMESPTRFNCRS